MKIKEIILFCLVCVIALTFHGCQQPGGESTGSEYMPDMAHSVAYEANYYNYYYNNTWGGEDEYYAYAQPKKPVAGTVARGYTGVELGSSDMTQINGQSAANAMAYTAASSAPYYYGDTDEERLRATAELLDNPYPITDEGLARAKELYITYCGICHGDKGDGAGYLVRDDGGKYPVAPANFLSEEFLAASNGRYYHAIMHGKNMMGSYTDKLSYEERWQVIHYIRALQAKETKMEYNQMLNTLNSVDKPAGEIVMEEKHEDGHDHDADHGHGNSHEGHGHDDDHGHSH